MSEKRIKTKEQKRLIIYDIIFFVFLNIFTYIFHSKTIIDFVKECISYNQSGNLVITFCYTICGILNFLMSGIILIIVYLAFRLTKMKSIKQNTTYTQTYGIDYYRDKLPTLTATEISLITDLNIENKKDISASLLSMYQKGIISFENNKIIENKEKVQSLNQSEKKLLEMLTSDKLDENEVKEWKKTCIDEAINEGYIQKARKDRYSYLNKINKILKNVFKIWWITFIVLLIIVMINMIPSFTNMYISQFKELKSNTSINENTENTVNARTSAEINKISNSTIEDLHKLMEDPIFFTISVIHALSIPTLIYGIIYRKSKMVVVKANESLQNNYERTEKGNEIVEKIAGLKRFISEFSQLSQREKEEIVTYAVLLEENEKIIKDIFSYKNLNISILDYCNCISGNVKNILESLTASQLFDDTYYINRIAHIFYKILTEDITKIKIEEYYYLWYHFNKLNQNEKDILKSDIENIIYENNNNDIMNSYNEKYTEIKNNTKLRNKWQKHMEELSAIHSSMNTYEDLYRAINYIANLVEK